MNNSFIVFFLETDIKITTKNKLNEVLYILFLVQ